MTLARRCLAQIKGEMSLPWMRPQPSSLVEISPESPRSTDSFEEGYATKSGSQDVESANSVRLPDATLALDGAKRRNHIWAIVACGTGLFSDGFINNSVGFFNTIIKQIYGKEKYSQSIAMSNISSLLFVGTVVGMLLFGWMSDYKSRKLSMIISTGILILFSVLVAGAWGVGMPKDPAGMFAAIAVYRTLLGIGIGGEYPAGAVATAEASHQISHGRRNRWFVWFTHMMVDLGYIAAALAAWILLYICGVGNDASSTHGLQTTWRLLFGLGAVCPIALFYMRTKFQESEHFEQNNLKRMKTPYWLLFKTYGPRLALVSLIWFLYDFLAYSWGIYSSQIMQLVVSDGNLHTTFGWTVLLNVFYLPGSFLGGYSTDYLGPRLTLLVGGVLQGIVGFIMVAQYGSLVDHVGPFVVAYGIFITLGEFGPGDAVAVLASKSAPSAIRGRYYGIAAAIGKIGAFVGGYAFPAIANSYGGLDTIRGQEVLLYLSSALCVFMALLAFLLPPLDQEAVHSEDVKFRKLLVDNGYDTSNMGSPGSEKVDC